MRSAVVVAVGLVGSACTPARGDPCARGVPGVREVEAAARRHAGLDDLPRARGRARRAALLPYVALRAARALDWDDRTSVPGPVSPVGHQVVVEARVTWHLDRLWFDPAEPRLSREERAAARARAALDDEVISLYFRWRRAADPLAADEALARLDAVTGGWLVDHLECPP